MARLDLGGLRDLWYRIDDIFARLTEAIGSISFSGTTLSWNYASGASAGSVNLDNTFATDAQAAHSLSLAESSLVLKSVSGATLSTVSLSTLLSQAVSSGIAGSGLISANTANDRFGSSLYLNGKSLSLISYDGTVLSTVTLP